MHGSRYIRFENAPEFFLIDIWVRISKTCQTGEGRKKNETKEIYNKSSIEVHHTSVDSIAWFNTSYTSVYDFDQRNVQVAVEQKGTEGKAEEQPAATTRGATRKELFPKKKPAEWRQPANPSPAA